MKIANKGMKMYYLSQNRIVLVNDGMPWSEFDIEKENLYSKFFGLQTEISWVF